MKEDLFKLFVDESVLYLRIKDIYRSSLFYYYLPIIYKFLYLKSGLRVSLT